MMNDAVSPLRCSGPVDLEFSSKAKGVMKLKEARLGFSENEDEDIGKWESEMTQEHDLTDYDDWDGDDGGTDKVILISSPSFSGEDNDYGSYEETGNMLKDSNDAAVEFESMIHKKTGCETMKQESSFMEIDPIPIPGPPGSFLPSPWDMTIEDHVYSSVITSQIQSSQDQLDLTDRNSSQSPVSAVSIFTAPETQILHNTITINKRPSRFRDNDQSCCCQGKEKSSEETTFSQPPPQQMIQQDLDILSKPEPVIPSTPNSVFRLMGKDLMVINQSEEEPSPKPTSQFLDLSKTQQVSPSVLHRPYNGDGLYLNTSTSFYNVP